MNLNENNIDNYNNINNINAIISKNSLIDDDFDNIDITTIDLSELTIGEQVILFIQYYLIVPDGKDAGKAVRLRKWQKKFIKDVYDEPKRRAILSMGRKNGKTALVAMLVIAHLIGPVSIVNGQIVSAARSRDQAAIVFDYAAKMVRMSDKLVDLIVVRDSAKILFCPLTGCKYKALSADATTALGISPFVVIHDELGQVEGPKDKLYEALETAMGAHENPLSIIISTQAPRDTDLLSLLIDDSIKNKLSNTIVRLYTAKDTLALDDKEGWFAANPALNDFRSLEELSTAIDDALRLPSREASIRNLYLNQRISTTKTLFAPSIWKLNGEMPDETVFLNNPCYGGIDLSEKRDLTAVVFAAMDSRTNKIHLKQKYFAPEIGLDMRAERDRAPYDIWAKDGLLTLTAGKSVNFEIVARYIKEMYDELDIKAVFFDAYRFKYLEAELQKIRCTVVAKEYSQSFKAMSPAIELLEDLMLNGRICHGMHPILTMCQANARVITDTSGNRKINKQMDRGRIDGMIATLMAVAGLGQSVERVSNLTPDALRAYFG